MTMTQAPEGLKQVNSVPEEVKGIENTSFSPEEIKEFQSIVDKTTNNKNNPGLYELQETNGKEMPRSKEQQEKDAQDRKTIQNFVNKYNNLNPQDKAKYDSAYPQLHTLVEDLTRVLYPYIMETKEKTTIEKQTGTVIENPDGKKIEQ